MGKVNELEAWRIEVEPDLPDMDDDQCREECYRVAREIRRHIAGRVCARVMVEQESYCSHCRHPWCETSETYNGGCCDEDEKNNPEEPVS